MKKRTGSLVVESVTTESRTVGTTCGESITPTDYRLQKRLSEKGVSFFARKLPRKRQKAHILFRGTKETGMYLLQLLGFLMSTIAACGAIGANKMSARYKPDFGFYMIMLGFFLFGVMLMLFP